MVEHPRSRPADEHTDSWDATSPKDLSAISLGLGRFSGHLRQWFSFLWRLECLLKGVRFGGQCVFLGRPIVSLAPHSLLTLGDNVTVASGVRCNTLGCFQPSVLRTLLPGSKLVLSDEVGLSGTVMCAASSIDVGKGTIFGSGAMVIDNDFHAPSGDWNWTMDAESSRATARPIKIGRGVFVGARAIILKGVTIGDRAIVGAGAVVTKDVPERHLAAGNPAIIIAPKSELR